MTALSIRLVYMKLFDCGVRNKIDLLTFTWLCSILLCGRDSHKLKIYNEVNNNRCGEASRGLHEDRVARPQ